MKMEVKKPQPKQRKHFKAIKFVAWVKMRFYVDGLIRIASSVKKGKEVERMKILTMRSRFWSFLFFFNDAKLYFEYLDFLTEDYNRLFTEL